MRVNTKYGEGILLGIDINGRNTISYKVLIDNEIEDNLMIEKRIYNCLNISVLSDDGRTVEFGNEIKIN